MLHSPSGKGKTSFFIDLTPRQPDNLRALLSRRGVLTLETTASLTTVKNDKELYIRIPYSAFNGLNAEGIYDLRYIGECELYNVLCRAATFVAVNDWDVGDSIDFNLWNTSLEFVQHDTYYKYGETYLWLSKAVQMLVGYFANPLSQFQAMQHTMASMESKDYVLFYFYGASSGPRASILN